jgi:competence protein ComEA
MDADPIDPPTTQPHRLTPGEALRAISWLGMEEDRVARSDRPHRIPLSRRRRMIASGAVVCLGYLAALMVAAGPAPNATIAVPVELDPSRASIAELMALDGVGRVRAEQIVLHRVRHGPFLAPNDLLNVDGLGEDTLKNIRAFLRVRVVPRGAQHD